MKQEKIGLFISKLRNENKMTQQELADKLGIMATSVSKWERGINAPDISYLTELSKIFSVTVNELLNGERNYKKRQINDNKVLEVENLSKYFGKRMIINNINFTIHEKEIVGLIGPNGAGKTTIIKTILSLYKATTGTVKICGYNTKKDLEMALSKTGSIVENPDMYLNISGKKNLKITALINDIKDDDFINEMIKFVGLEERINDKVKKYSLGMRQRLGLANALIKKPKLLILDEPTNGLDPMGIRDLRMILEKISEEENMGILISSHILSEVENICDRVIIIDKGNIIKDLGIEEVKYKNKSLEELFIDTTNNYERGDRVENN